MARGIITTKPTSGNSGSKAGSIMVTNGATTPAGGNDGGNTGGTVAGDPTTPAGNNNTTTVLAATQTLAVGQAVAYTQTTTANLGDIVDFNVDADGNAIDIAVFKTGTSLTGETHGALTVNAGDSVLVSAHIGGKITVNGGYLTILNKSHIEGNIESTTDNSFVFVSGTHVEGKIAVSGVSYFGVQTSVIEKDVISNGNIFAGVMNNTIKGKLDVTNATTCKCSGNTVSGSTNTPGCA